MGANITRPLPSNHHLAPPPLQNHNCHYHLRLVGKAGNMSRARGTLSRTARTSEGARYLWSSVKM